MFWLVDILVPIAICVILPVLIVWIVFRAAVNKDNKNAEVLMKAIENHSTIDADKLVEAMGRPKKTDMQVLQLRLLRGCFFTFLGVAAAIVCVILSYCAPESHLQNVLMMLSGASLAIGIAYLVVYFVTRKNVGDN